MIATQTDYRQFENPEHLPGTAAHCKRVAAWCEELALALRLPAHERSALIEVSLSHHQPELIFGDGFQRLITDMGFRTQSEATDPAAVSRLSTGILRAFKNGSSSRDQ